MKLKNNSQEFYTNFKENLTKSQKWPGIYMFKFIIKSNNIKPDFFKKYFTKDRYTMTVKESSKNYSIVERKIGLIVITPRYFLEVVIVLFILIFVLILHSFNAILFVLFPTL